MCVFVMTSYLLIPAALTPLLNILLLCLLHSSTAPQKAFLHGSNGIRSYA